MKDAFDDLEIIDERKPEILVSSLRKGSEFVDANNIQELQQCKFPDSKRIPPNQ